MFYERGIGTAPTRLFLDTDRRVICTLAEWILHALYVNLFLLPGMLIFIRNNFFRLIRRLREIGDAAKKSVIRMRKTFPKFLR